MILAILQISSDSGGIRMDLGGCERSCSTGVQFVIPRIWEL